ncbi:MAG: NUDIX hydrolase [Candidatus Magasanikbacteria bacterium]
MKIPKIAKKVFSGEIFDVYQWPQKMYDGSMATFEMIKRPDTVEIIATKGNKVVVCKQKQPQHTSYYPSLFSGRMDKKRKTPLQAAKRELLEESGLTSNDWKLFNVYMPVSKMEWSIYVYIARNCTYSKKQNLDGGEKIKIQEISFENFFNLMIQDKFLVKQLAVDIMRMKLEGKRSQLKKLLFKK